MCYQWHDGDLTLRCVIQPKNNNNGFAGIADNGLKILVTPAPTDSKANKHLINYLAGQLKVPHSQHAHQWCKQSSEGYSHK